MSEDWQGESRRELAEDRTTWAHERTLLAKERTYAAWIRTGLAMIGAGLAVTRLLDAFELQWLVVVLGVLLVVLGGTAIGMGFWSYRKTLKALEEEGVRGIPAWFLAGFTLGLLVVALLGLVLIFRAD